VTNSSLPSKALLEAQAKWLAPARARLLRRVGIARRRRILDLGAGYGVVTGELQRRGGGFVAALDQVETAVSHAPGFSICGNVLSIPFADNSFDLVFCQCVLMWVLSPSSISTPSVDSITKPSLTLETAVSEIHRVLEPNGVLIALEPDYAGMIEYPPSIATRDIWLSSLTRAGAEPQLGRILPGMLADKGFQVRVDLFDSLLPPDPARFDFLRSLSLTADEAKTLEMAAMAESLIGSWQQIVHLPFFLISATNH